MNNKRKLTLKDKLKAIGPGAIITASFIGPGTVTSATRAGATYGYALLWTVIFSIIATMVLQEMSARLGIITQEGLGEALREQFENPILKYGSMYLVIIAIGIGCAAYISGDILGGSLGIATLTGLPQRVLGPAVGIITLILVLTGNYKIIEKVLMVLVAIMCVTFITTMVVVKPDFGAILKGAFVPTIPKGSIVTTIALIGTTVVPYNFFIHASTVKERWNKPEDLELSRWDIIFSIGVGGLITAAILITSGTVLFGSGIQVKNVADLSIQLEPLLGNWAKVFTCAGLFAAGFSSAIATPLGASYTIGGILNWKTDMSDKRFKAVSIVIILIGIFMSATGLKPMDVILFAQAINGILLPVVAFFLLYIMNNKKRLGAYTNSLAFNIIGAFVVLVCTGLGIYSFIDAIKAFMG